MAVGYTSGTEKANPSDWVTSYSDILYSYTVVRVGEREVAKDLVQETFLSALERLDTFRGESTEKTWLFSILKNKIIDHYRKKSAERTVPSASVVGLGDEDPYFEENGRWRPEELPTDWGVGHLDQLRSKEFSSVLQQCFTRLTTQCRAVFMMKYLDELEFEEICKALMISTSNYWVIIHRAKLQLRDCLERKWIRA